MPSAPLIGPVEGGAARLRAGEPGRLAIDDLTGDSVGSGWVEPAGVVGATAFARASTAAVPSAGAVREVLVSALAQARAAGAERLLWETDDDRVGLDGVVPLPPLRVTNSLGRRLERVVTREPGRVGMYSCGPTVYSYQHIGNMRAYLFADTLKRALLWRGLDVHHVINITDVGHLMADADEGEDKVEEASRAEGRTVEEITSHYTDVYWADLRALGVLFPDEWPKASLHVPEMINFAAVLEDHGYGYPLPQGLYFDTSLQADYGALAGIDTAAQRETAGWGTWRASGPGATSPCGGPSPTGGRGSCSGSHRGASGRRDGTSSAR
jgi:hypothetical protein